MQLYSIIGLSIAAIFSSIRMSSAYCDLDIVESMPDGLKLKDPDGTNIIRTHQSLLEMIERANKTLRIASFYLYLTPPKDLDGNPAALPGRMILDAITSAVKRGVDLQVVLDRSGRHDINNQDDVKLLESIGSVRFVNMTKLLHSGVMHTKFLIADNQTFYLGSSNFDWRSYSEIKEMGVSLKNCPEMAQDLDKVFRTYVLVSNASTIPRQLSDDLKTTINMQNPLVLTLNHSTPSSVFLGASPPPFNGEKDWSGRTDDIDGLLHLIDSARHRVSISVMNYSPRMEFVWPKVYWPRIDNALRKAATTRGVKVELLFSNWTSTRSSEIAWYKSLNAIQSSDFHGGGIHVKLFKVPAFDDYQKRIPFARVKHDKYLVTDTGVYLGTSNWTPDYFINTAGVSMVIRPTNSHKQDEIPSVLRSFQAIFDRDFNSEYAHELN